MAQVLPMDWRQTHPDAGGSQQLVLAPGESLRGVDFGARAEPAEVLGSVWVDGNANGQRDGVERGRPEAAVQLDEWVDREMADQINDRTPEAYTHPCSGGGHLWQSFTPSASLLTAVDLRLNPTSIPLSGVTTRIEIRSASVRGPVLATASAFVPRSVGYGSVLVHFAFDSPIPVVRQQTYFIDWRGSPFVEWTYRTDNPYPSGTAYDPTGAVVSNWDFNFITYGRGTWREVARQDTADDDPATPGIDESGTYRFAGLPPGNYAVKLSGAPGWQGTSPADGTHHAEVAPKDRKTGMDFGSLPNGPTPPVAVARRSRGPVCRERRRLDPARRFTVLAPASRPASYRLHLGPRWGRSLRGNRPQRGQWR